MIAALEDLPADDHIVQIEFIEIKDTVIEMKAYGWADLFSMGPERNFHRVILGYLNQVFQQISGINLITYYAPTIYKQYIGLEGITPSILAAANGTEYFLASWFAVYTIEKFGRRQLMLFGAAGQAGSMAILAGMNYMSSVGQGGSVPGIMSALFLFVFNTFFAIGWLGMYFQKKIAKINLQRLQEYPGYTPPKSSLSKFEHQQMDSPQAQTGHSTSWS